MHEWVGFPTHWVGGWDVFSSLPCEARCEARCEAGLYFLSLARHEAKRSAVRSFSFHQGHGAKRSEAKRSPVPDFHSFPFGGHGAKHGARLPFQGWVGGVFFPYSFKKARPPAFSFLFFFPLPLPTNCKKRCANCKKGLDKVPALCYINRCKIPNRRCSHA